MYVNCCEDIDLKSLITKFCSMHSVVQYNSTSLHLQQSRNMPSRES